MTAPILAPSILAANYTHLKKDIEESIKGGAQWIHCDIMDGHFVPNISFGPMIVKAANDSTDAFLDVHLMIYNPDDYIKNFVDAGADLISIHIEATQHLHRSIELIKSLGIKAGVAVNPATSLQNLEPILPYVDLVILMSVNPGFGGQTFIGQSYDRIKDLVTMRQKDGIDFLIEVDGGINLENIEQISKCGTDVFVAGSSVFKADNIESRVKELIKRASHGKQLLV
jgi:ribulose-phosphate 3-epimerase